MRGEESWKEAKLGLIVRGDKYLSHREGGRGLISQARYVGVLGEQEEFEPAVDAALRVEAAAKAKAVVWVGDGALGNWGLAQRLRPGCVEVLDWKQALDHGRDCGRALLGEATELAELW